MSKQTFRVLIELDMEAETVADAANQAREQVVQAMAGDTLYMHVIDPANGFEWPGLLEIAEGHTANVWKPA